MAKRAREQAVREKRARKQQKKDDRRLAALQPDVPETDEAPDGTEAPESADATEVAAENLASPESSDDSPDL